LARLLRCTAACPLAPSPLQAAELAPESLAGLTAGVHRAYGLLSAAASTKQGAHLVGATFDKHPCVWVGDGFAFSRNVAMGGAPAAAEAAAAAAPAPAPAPEQAEGEGGGRLLPSRCAPCCLMAGHLHTWTTVLLLVPTQTPVSPLALKPTFAPAWRAGAAAAAATPAPPSFKPWLHTVPPDFRQYSQLLWMAGVRSQFSAANYAAGLSTIAAAKAGGALEDSELAAALRLAEHLASALQQVGAG
jgi:hypothetical protein